MYIPFEAETEPRKNLNVNTQIQIPNLKKGIVSMVSKSNRFITPQVDKNPGPGAYDTATSSTPRLRADKTAQKHVTTHSNPNVSLEYQWIMSSTRCNFNSPHNKAQPGPGLYDPELHIIPVEQRSPWPKSKRFSSQQHETGRPAVGPGTYDWGLKQKTKPKVYSVFKSKTPKLYGFEKDTHHVQSRDRQPNDATPQSNNPYTQYLTEQQHLKQLQKCERIKKAKYSVFVSKVPRLKALQYCSTLKQIGPGTYQVQQQKHIRKETIRKSTMIVDQPSASILQMRKNRVRNKSPGPGQYSPEQYELKKSVQKKGYPVFKQTRSKSFLTETPGPGHYMKKRFEYIKEPPKGLHRKPNLNSISFLSSSDRLSPEMHQGSAPTYYNTDLYNLQYRMQKKKEHMKKLTKMDVKIPAFDSQQTRLK